MIRRFLRDTGFSVVGQVVGVVFGLASSIVIARVLGAEQRGVLAIAVLLPLKAPDFFFLFNPVPAFVFSDIVFKFFFENQSV